MKRLVLAVIVFLLGMGTASAVDFKEFDGVWANTDTNTHGLTKVMVKGAGDKAKIRVWGKCSPQDCDWGWTNCDSYADGHLSTCYRTDIAERNLTITVPSPGTLKVQMHTHFIDDSGRPDQDATYTFRHMLTPVQSSPKPMGKTQVKPYKKQPTGKY